MYDYSYRASSTRKQERVLGFGTERAKQVIELTESFLDVLLRRIRHRHIIVAIFNI